MERDIRSCQRCRRDDTGRGFAGCNGSFPRRDSVSGNQTVERGRVGRDVFDAFTHMTRQPDAVGLDLKCEIAANNVAKARVEAMYKQYGPEMMNAVSTEMIHYTESVLRSRLRGIH